MITARGFLSRPDPVYPLLWRVADNEVRSIVVGGFSDFRELDYIKEVSLADHHALLDVEYFLRTTQNHCGVHPVSPDRSASLI